MFKKITFCAVIAAVLFVFLYFVPIPVKADFQLTGVVHGKENPLNCSVSFAGHELRYLFKADTLKGTVTVASDTFGFTSDISGPIVSIPEGDPNENIHWASCARYDAEQNHYVSCTLFWTDDHKTFVLKDNSLFYCVSELENADVLHIFDQILSFAS